MAMERTSRFVHLLSAAAQFIVILSSSEIGSDSIYIGRSSKAEKSGTCSEKVW